MHKWKWEENSVLLSDTLLREIEKEELFHEIGILEVQQEVINKYITLKKEKEFYENELKEITKPVVLTEGKNDAKIIQVAWGKLFPGKVIPFDTVASGEQIEENDRTGNADQVRKALIYSANIINNQIIIGLFDNDREGNCQYKGLKNDSFEKHDIEKIVRKHKKKRIFALLLPVPELRKIFVTEIITQRYLEIEHYFNNNILEKYLLKGNNILNTEVFCINNTLKTKFAHEIIESLDSSEFENFRILFDKIEEIIKFLFYSMMVHSLKMWMQIKTKQILNQDYPD